MSLVLGVSGFVSSQVQAVKYTAANDTVNINTEWTSKATAAGDQSVAVGGLATAGGKATIAVGQNAQANSDWTVAVGQAAGSGATHQDYSLILGTQAGQNADGTTKDTDEIRTSVIEHLTPEEKALEEEAKEQLIKEKIESVKSGQSGRNLYMGYQAGYSSKGGRNTFIGSQNAGRGAVGDLNIGIGQASLASAQGSNNSALGVNSGQQIKGSKNVAVGMSAGWGAQGNEAVYVGTEAGNSSGQSDSSIMIGRYAGKESDGTSNIKNPSTELTQLSSALAAEWKDKVMAALTPEEKKLPYSQRMALVNQRVIAAVQPLLVEAMKSGQNVFIGDSAGASTVGAKNTAIGTYSGENVNGGFNTALGIDSGRNITGDYNTSIGRLSGDKTEGLSNVALGTRAGNSVTGNTNISIGMQAGFKTKGNNNILMGTNAGTATTSGAAKDSAEPVTGDFNIIIGNASGNGLKGSSNTVVGNTAGGVITGERNTVMGSYAGTDMVGTGLVAIGNEAGKSLSNGIFVDKKLRTVEQVETGVNGYEGNVAIGNRAGKYIQGDGNVFLGGYAGTITSEQRNVSTDGFDFYRDKEASISSPAKVIGAVAIGAQAVVTGNGNMAIGYHASSAQMTEDRYEADYVTEKENWHPAGETANNIAFGYEAKANATKAANTERSIAFGYRANVDSATSAIAIGDKATTVSNNTIVIGNGSKTVAEYKTDGTVAEDTGATGSIAIGAASEIDKEHVVALGNKITKTAANSVFLGKAASYVEATTATAPATTDGTADEATEGAPAEETAKAATITDDSRTAGLEKTYTLAKIGDTTYKFAGGNQVTGVVSVGSDTETRRIQNVAPGFIGANSTDAINGSQLYAAMNAPVYIYRGGSSNESKVYRGGTQVKATGDKDYTISNLSFAFTDGLQAETVTENGKDIVKVGMTKDYMTKLDDAIKGATDATNAANTAAEKANTAAGNADTAASAANQAAGKADGAANAANTAAGEANKATGAANDAAENATKAATGAGEAAGKANEAATNAGNAAEAANTAADTAKEAAGKADAAAGNATDAADAATKATGEAKEATGAANDAATNATKAATGAGEAAGKANEAATNAGNAAEAANTAANDAGKAAVKANEAADNANKATERVNNAIGDMKGSGIEAGDVHGTEDSLAAGKGSDVKADEGTAIGNGAKVTDKATNSVAIGAGSVADRPNTVSVGSEGHERVITNVAPGLIAKDSTDAVNGGQLYAVEQKVDTNTERIGQVAQQVGNNTQAIRDLRKESRKGDAMNAALAALKPVAYNPAEPTQIMAGVGFNHGEQAVAIGAAHYVNGRTMLNAGIAYAGNSDVMANVGVTWRVGQGEVPEDKAVEADKAAAELNSRVQSLEQTVNEQREQIEKLMALLQAK